MKQRPAGSPPLEEKLRYHQMRKDGLCGTWEEYLKLRVKLDTPTPEPKPIQNISLDDYEPGENPPRTEPKDDLGF